MGVFHGTAWYYARFRPAYPPELLGLLADALGLDGTGRLLDLGCGTGQLAIPLAPCFEEVVAVDREPEMLAELCAAAPANVTATLASAEDVDESWGTFRLATAGRAFHWFEGERVLDTLASLTPAVALAGDTIDDSEALTSLLHISQELLGERPPMRQGNVRYAEALARSAFSNVETLSVEVEVEREWTVDRLIDLAYSTSFASLSRVGGRREEFERELRSRLEPIYRERSPVDVVLGRQE